MQSKCEYRQYLEYLKLLNTRDLEKKKHAGAILAIGVLVICLAFVIAVMIQ